MLDFLGDDSLSTLVIFLKEEEEEEDDELLQVTGNGEAPKKPSTVSIPQVDISIVTVETILRSSDSCVWMELAYQNLHDSNTSEFSVKMPLLQVDLNKQQQLHKSSRRPRSSDHRKKKTQISDNNSARFSKKSRRSKKCYSNLKGWEKSKCSVGRKQTNPEKDEKAIIQRAKTFDYMLEDLVKAGIKSSSNNNGGITMKRANTFDDHERKRTSSYSKTIQRSTPRLRRYVHPTTLGSQEHLELGTFSQPDGQSKHIVGGIPLESKTHWKTFLRGNRTSTNSADSSRQKRSVSQSPLSLSRRQKKSVSRDGQSKHVVGGVPLESKSTECPKVSTRKTSLRQNLTSTNSTDSSRQGRSVSHSRLSRQQKAFSQSLLSRQKRSVSQSPLRRQRRSVCRDGVSPPIALSPYHSPHRKWRCTLKRLPHKARDLDKTEKTVEEYTTISGSTGEIRSFDDGVNVTEAGPTDESIACDTLFEENDQSPASLITSYISKYRNQKKTIV